MREPVVRKKPRANQLVEQLDESRYVTLEKIGKGIGDMAQGFEASR